MTSFYLGKHHLIDVEGLVDDSDFIAGLLFIPFWEDGKNVFFNIISKVVNLQNLLAVLFVVQEENGRIISRLRKRKTMVLTPFTPLTPNNILFFILISSYFSQNVC